MECDSVALNFGLQKILSSVYVKCLSGEIVGLLGRNGSGKSSLMRIIHGTQSSESKSVRINDELLNGLTRNTIAYLPQRHFIPTFLTIAEAYKIYNVNSDIVVDIFKEFKSHLQKKPGSLSGGILRIFEIFLVAGLPSKFILFDEPFSGIMPIHIEQLKLFMTQLKIEKGVVITDHLYKHVTEISDRVYVLVNGKTYPITNHSQLHYYGYVREPL